MTPLCQCLKLFLSPYDRRNSMVLHSVDAKTFFLCVLRKSRQYNQLYCSGMIYIIIFAHSSLDFAEVNLENRFSVSTLLDWTLRLSRDNGQIKSFILLTGDMALLRRKWHKCRKSKMCMLNEITGDFTGMILAGKNITN